MSDADEEFDEFEDVDEEEEAQEEEDEPKAPATPRTSIFSRSHTVLEPWEQQAAFALGGLTIVVGVAGWIARAVNESKGELAGLAAISLVAGVLFILAARTKRRLLTAFASLAANFAAAPYRAAAFLQFACVALGGLIILRTSNEAARKAGEERRRRRQEEKGAGVRGGGRSTGRGATTKATGPAPNKRYTPPKPKKKRPAPTPPPRESKRSEETT